MICATFVQQSRRVQNPQRQTSGHHGAGRGQRSINAFFKAPAIATSVVLKPAAGVPAEDAESKGVAESADPLVEDPSTNGGGADWQLGGCPRRPVATYKRRRRVDGGKGGGISTGRREGRVQG
jgi:hypothetical protein